MKFNFFLFLVLVGSLLTLQSYGQDFVNPEGEDEPILTTNFVPDPADYEIINGNISEPLLKRYLKRCTNAWLVDYAPIGSVCNGAFFDFQKWDNLMNFIRQTHPKLINLNAAVVPWAMWAYTGGCDNFTPRLIKTEHDVHDIDPQIILTALLYEYVSDLLGKDTTGGIWISIPQWVKDSLADNAIISAYLQSQTHFKASEMLLPGSNDMVDINRPMTIAWYYFWGKQYIDIGIEAISIAQLNKIGANDNLYQKTGYLANKLRNYAKINGRRNFCLIFGGFAYVGSPANDTLLFDYGSSVMYISNTGSSGNGTSTVSSGIRSYGDGLQFPNKVDYEALLGECTTDPGYPYSIRLSGHHPLGWYTHDCPYLVQIDMDGGSQPKAVFSPAYNPTCHYPWRYDEASWYSFQSKLYRDRFLIYAWHKVRCLDYDAAYMELPGQRGYRFPSNPAQNYDWFAYDASGGQYQAGLIKNIWDANDDVPPPGLEYYSRWAQKFLQTLDYHPNDYPEGKLYYGDFDGDGNVDILETADKSKGQYWGGWRLYLQQTGFNFSQPTQTGSYPSWTERFYVGDYNGDGNDDFIVTADETQTPGSSWYGYKLYTSTGNGFNFTSSDTWPGWGEKFYIGDYDGNGMDDFLVTADQPIILNNAWQGHKVYTSTGTGFNYSFFGSWPSWGEKFYIGDFNGDNLSDFIVTADKDILQGNTWGGNKVYHSNGFGFDYKAYSSWPAWGENFVICDWNRDGHDDMTVVASNQNNVNWLGSKTYLCNDKGNHFIYAFDYADIGLQSNTNANVYARTKYFSFYNDVNILMASNTYPGAEGLVNWMPLHCTPDIWTSQKPGRDNISLNELSGTYNQNIAIKPNELPVNGHGLPGVSSTLSLDQINNEIRHGIYPNPSKGVFHISSQYIQESMIEVSDCYGKKIVEKYTDQSNVSVDLSGYSNGVYFMTIKSKQYSFKYQLTVSK